MVTRGPLRGLPICALTVSCGLLPPEPDTARGGMGATIPETSAEVGAEVARVAADGAAEVAAGAGVEALWAGKEVGPAMAATKRNRAILDDFMAAITVQRLPQEWRTSPNLSTCAVKG